MKRVFDIFASGFLLLILSPVLIACAIAIQIESGTPILYRQERVGKDQRTFRIRKFRTMRPGVGAVLTSGHDPRITRVGRFLRSTKIDELPQLLDVLQGRMSLVGPRPEVPQYVAYWPDSARETVLSVRPGITDPASIAFRRESEILAQAEDVHAYYISEVLPRKLVLYEEYVRNQSLLGDLKILWQTFITVVVR